MKLSSLGLVAWMLLGQISLADDAQSAVPLPPGSHVSPIAQQAAEAPRWSPPGAGTTAAPANIPIAQPSGAPVAAPAATAIPSGNMPTATATQAPPAGAYPPRYAPTPAAAPVNSPMQFSGTPTPAVMPQPAAGVASQPQMLPASDDAKPLSPSLAESPAESAEVVPDQPRPLHSVMIHRPPKIATPTPAEPTSEVAPAAYEEPLPAPPSRSPTMAPSYGPVMGSSIPQDTATAPAATVPAEPPIDPEKIAAARAAADLLASSFESRLENIKVITLLETLSQTNESARAAAIQDYWRLWRAWADYHWAEDERHQLEEVVPTHAATDAPMVSTALAAASARVHEAKVNVQILQDALMRSAHLPIQTSTYRPSDPPLVGPYHTYFNVLFANRQAPGRTLQIDRTLPIRLKALDDRAAAVQSAATAVHAAQVSHSKNETDIRTVLACHEELYRQRRALLDEVMNYNLDIGDYATTIASPGTPNEKLVAMLIDTKSSERPASTPNTASTSGASRAAAGTRPGFNDGWVPSTMRTLDSAPQSQSQRYRNPNSSAEADRYSVPTVGDRYSNGTR